MRIADSWKDYEMIDTSCGEKLERWGNFFLVRPDPQVIWNTEKVNKLWYSPDALYHRSDKGGGSWEYFKKMPEFWKINYKDLTFKISPTGFKHTGLFPEQAVNWDFFTDIIKKQNRPISVLNLFAYTGGATLACSAAGAKVCHVDASKGMVAWARENAMLSGLQDNPIRWIVDDCEKFVAREIRRNNKYDVVILDPPSYGRGPSGEIWKLEEKIFPLMELITNVLSDNPLLVALNSYTTGLSPSVMGYLLNATVKKKFDGEIFASEIGLPVTESNIALPCGSTAMFIAK